MDMQKLIESAHGVQHSVHLVQIKLRPSFVTNQFNTLKSTRRQKFITMM